MSEIVKECFQKVKLVLTKLKNTAPVLIKYIKRKKKQVCFVHTYVVLLQVRVVPLDAVVEDGHDDALAGVALLPGGAHVHVQTVLGATVLGENRK